MNNVLVYTEKAPNRLTYIFDLLLADLLGLAYTITHSKETFAAHNGPRFSYATAPVGNELFFESDKFLFETNIAYQPINFCEWNELRGFYPVNDNSAISFDIFASAFYMVSCYAEYLPSKIDKYGRYRASQSMNFRGDFLEKPMVNLYSLAIKKLLAERFPQLAFTTPRFKYLSTFDIDIAYSYLGKGMKRTLGGFAKAFLLSEFRDIQNRFRVLSGTRKDPYDTYDYMLQVCRDFDVETMFFIQVGDESSFDKNIPHTNGRFKKLVKRLYHESTLGVHLSFRSHRASRIMETEIERLKELTGDKVIRNRFHYLRFQLPSTYQRIDKLGITEDYSMGYAPHAGFRAGICTPYYFYNLKTEEATTLKIFPLAFMDTTFTHYYKADTQYSIERMQRIMGYVHQVGGTCISLWHNSSFTEQREWKGWRNVFETITREGGMLMKQQ